MTSLMISMTLGFIIFLNIVGMLPYAREMQESFKETGEHSLVLGHYNLPIIATEAVLRNHSYAFKSWGATANDAYNKYGDLFYT